MSAGAQAYAQAPSRRVRTYQRAVAALFSDMNSSLSANDRRQAWERARDDAHLAFRIWCSAPYGTKREAFIAYRAAADREDVAIAALATT